MLSNKDLYGYEDHHGSRENNDRNKSLDDGKNTSGFTTITLAGTTITVTSDSGSTVTTTVQGSGGTATVTTTSIWATFTQTTYTAAGTTDKSILRNAHYHNCPTTQTVTATVTVTNTTTG